MSESQPATRLGTLRSSGAPQAALFDTDFLRRLEKLKLVSKRVLPGTFRGEHRSKRRGSGVEFADYRPYVEGDPVRLVDWGAYLRFDKLLVRLFHEEGDLPITVLLDASRSMGFDPPGTPFGQRKFVYARKLAAALTYVGLNNLDRVRLFVFDQRVRDVLERLRGAGSIHRVLNYLMEAEPHGETNLAAALRPLGHGSQRGLVVLISDLFDPDPAAALEKLDPRYDLLVLRLTHPSDRRPQLRAGRIRLVDAEDGSDEIVDLSSDLLRHYSELLSEQDEALLSLCRRRQWGYIMTGTEKPFDELVLDILRSGRML